MRKNIHPKWYPNARVICACGNTWTVGATVEEIRTDVCSQCHPFFTGEQRIVDTAGQVERFMRRLEARDQRVAARKAQAEAQAAVKEAERRARRRGESPEKAAELARKAAESAQAEQE
ncbi:MAG: 50S ribosomal protein L31 [Chloroflexi bacterium]|nr:50S ribosomal protein L31 [Chloroflexota bacterium]